MDDDIGWNDFALRNYDPQIGRWVQQDPYEQYPSLYSGMGDDPINNIDPSGGLSIDFGTISTLGRAGVFLGGAAVGFAVDKLTGGKGWTGAAIGGALALGATFIPPFDIGDLFKSSATKSLAVNGVNIGVNLVKQTLDISRIQNQLELVKVTPPKTPSLTPPRNVSSQNNPHSPNLRSPQNGVSELSLSNDGIRFLVRNEGVRLRPYNDSKGYATVGIGHLIAKRPVTKQDIADWAWLDTKEEASDLLRSDLSTKYEPAIRRLVKVALTQAQYDAIVSFTYNVGIGSLSKGTGLAGSRFLRELNEGRPNGNLMLRFRRPADIIGRRQREVNLFNLGRY